jgi:hypothetical protein
MAQNKTHQTWWNSLSTEDQIQLRKKHFARQLSDKTIKRLYKFEAAKQ